jgi:hypothetical protein
MTTVRRACDAHALVSSLACPRSAPSPERRCFAKSLSRSSYVLSHPSHRERPCGEANADLTRAAAHPSPWMVHLGTHLAERLVFRHFVPAQAMARRRGLAFACTPGKRRQAPLAGLSNRYSIDLPEARAPHLEGPSDAGSIARRAGARVRLPGVQANAKPRSDSGSAESSQDAWNSGLPSTCVPT